mgnify:FL=1
MNVTLGQLGVKEEHVDWLTANCLRTMSYAILNSPRVPEIYEIEQLFLKCI